MPINQDTKKFQESITQELNTIKDRVRNLIGNKHWGEEGRYKEVILRNVLKRFLPQNISIGTGFILSEQKNISKQMDIIIYDNTYPIFFQEGDFIITPEHNVKGIIEVKSKITNSDIKTILNKFTLSINEIFKKKQLDTLFLGIFSYEEEVTIESLQEVLKYDYKINHITLGTNRFIKRWRNKDKRNLIGMENLEDNQNDFYNIYNINSLSYSYFISNAIAQICSIKEKGSWVYFPIEGTKEIYKENTVKIILQADLQQIKDDY